jgi:superfamily II DNA or RNA helicase
MQLRPYQNEAIEKLRTSIANGNKRIILCAPTGAGKTVIFSEMCRSAIAKGKTVMIVTDRVELLTQSGGALNRFKIAPEYIQATTTHLNRYSIYVAMVETIYRRLSQPKYLELFKRLDLIIFDEAHKQTFSKLMPFVNANTIIIGATATPYRQGNQESLDKYYTEIVNVVDVQDLIKQGYLAKPSYFGVKVDLQGIKTVAGEYDSASLGAMYSASQQYKGVLKNYKRLANGKKTLIFCTNIASSIELCAEFKAHGVPIMHVDASTNPVERRNALNWYKVTPNAVLSNVGLFTTGFDEPSTECIILYRATKSVPLFLQMCGRGSRTGPNKDGFRIIDFGNNILTHGFWDDPREWSLNKKEKKKDGNAPVKMCQNCGALVSASTKVCTYCGYEFISEEVPPPEYIELHEITRDKYVNLNKQQAMQMARDGDVQTWSLLAKAKKINPIWVIKSLCSNLQQAEQFTDLMGYAHGWLWIHWS